MFSLQTLVGTPARQTKFLVDLSGQDSFVVAQSTRSYLTPLDKFYKLSESTSGRYINMSQLFTDEAMGFYMQSQPISDRLCLSHLGESNVCLDDFNMLSVVQVSQNFWNSEIDTSDIGGILGMNLDRCLVDTCTSCWKGYGETTKIAVELG